MNSFTPFSLVSCITTYSVVSYSKPKPSAYFLGLTRRRGEAVSSPPPSFLFGRALVGVPWMLVFPDRFVRLSSSSERLEGTFIQVSWASEKLNVAYLLLRKRVQGVTPFVRLFHCH